MSLVKNVNSLIIGISFGILVLWGWDLYKDYINKPSFIEVDGITMYESTKRKGWDLWIYSTDTPKLDYETDEIFGLSKELCMTEGLARTRNRGSFQCGKNCYTSQTTFEDGATDTIDICEIMCEKSGCRE